MTEYAGPGRYLPSRDARMQPCGDQSDSGDWLRRGPLHPRTLLQALLEPSGDAAGHFLHPRPRPGLSRHDSTSWTALHAGVPHMMCTSHRSRTCPCNLPLDYSGVITTRSEPEADPASLAARTLLGDEHFTPLPGEQHEDDGKTHLIGDLAKALNRRPRTIRGWISSGIIPDAGNKNHVGMRRWSAGDIEAIVNIAADEGLLNKPRKIVKYTNFSQRVWEHFASN